MNRRQKKLQGLLHGGIGANVVDGDLKLAISMWKQEVKRSNILREVFDRREFIKPSTTKKNTISRAKHKQKMQTLKGK